MSEQTIKVIAADGSTVTLKGNFEVVREKWTVVSQKTAQDWLDKYYPDTRKTAGELRQEFFDMVNRRGPYFNDDKKGVPTVDTRGWFTEMVQRALDKSDFVDVAHCVAVAYVADKLWEQNKK